MRRPRTFLIAAVIALAASFTVGFHTPLRDGPIPCLDGSTVDFGQLCPVPTVDCANGTKVVIGQFCPVGEVAAQAPPPTTLSDLFTDVPAGLHRLVGLSQEWGPTRSSAGAQFSGTNLQADQSTFGQWTVEKSGMRVFFQQGKVAPSRFGVVDLLIPWGSLTDLLKPGVFERVTS